MDVSGRLHALAILLPLKNRHIHCSGGWVGPRASLNVSEKSVYRLLGLEPQPSDRSVPADRYRTVS
jgi:hypothetical protein